MYMHLFASIFVCSDFLLVCIIKHKFDICKQSARGGSPYPNSSVSRSDFNYRCIFMCMLCWLCFYFHPHCNYP